MNNRFVRLVVLALTVALISSSTFAMAELKYSGQPGYIAPGQPQAIAASKGLFSAKALLKGIKIKRSAVKLTLNSERKHVIELQNSLYPVPSSAVLPDVTWSSSAPNVAVVDPRTGKVTVIKEGTATIKAVTDDDKQYESTLKITAKAVNVKSITPDKSIATIDVNGTVKLTATISPKNATYPEIRYESLNTKIATVDEKGVVTGRSGGIAEIRLMADSVSKQKSVTCKVQVRSGSPSTFKVSAVGDVILGGDTPLGTYVNFQKNLTKYRKEMPENPNGGSMLANAAKYFRDDDLTIANLEVALTNGGTRIKGTYRFHGKPEYAKILSEASIEAVNITNNHTISYGSSGYLNTKRSLNSAGVKWSGQGFAESSVVNINGLKVGLMGFRTGSIYANTTKIRKDVAKLKKVCDVVIVSLHLADIPEYTFKVNSKMRSYGHTAVNAGADLVLCHHPHVLSGLEYYKGRNIAYGLGSFLSVGKNPGRPRRTFIYQQSFAVYDGFVEVKDTGIVPFWITSDITKKVNDMKPMYAPSGEDQEIIKMIDKYSVGEKVDYVVVPRR